MTAPAQQHRPRPDINLTRLDMTRPDELDISTGRRVATPTIINLCAGHCRYLSVLKWRTKWGDLAHVEDQRGRIEFRPTMSGSTVKTCLRFGDGAGVQNRRRRGRLKAARARDRDRPANLLDGVGGIATGANHLCRKTLARLAIRCPCP